MQNILKQIQKTRDSGQKEYAHDEDNVFANFERVANTLNITREKALMVYMLKHIDGIVSYIDGHKSQREDVRGRITDVIVYSMLLWGMVEDEEDSIR
jgi:carboxylesterase type B